MVAWLKGRPQIYGSSAYYLVLPLCQLSINKKKTSLGNLGDLAIQKTAATSRDLPRKKKTLR